MGYKTELPCVISGHSLEACLGDRCLHHLYTRKRYPELANCAWNCIPVCIKHHGVFHNKTLFDMSTKYRSVLIWLTRNEWYLDSYTNKWWHNKEIEKC